MYAGMPGLRATEGEKRPRWCASPDAWMHTVSDWCDYLLGRQWCPHYQPTYVEELELQRENLALALIGQLTVVSFRLWTGHVAGGVVGLIVFVVGNRARCSLQTSSLTAYICFSFALGALDSADLLQHLGAGLTEGFGTDFFALPFQTHVLQDLGAISILLAPVTEIYGAWTASGSYAKPDMFFLPQNSTVACTLGYGPVSWYTPEQMVPRPLVTPFRAQAWAEGFHGCPRTSAAGLGHCWVAAAEPLQPQGGGQTWQGGSGQACSCQETCAGCGALLASGSGWRGTGPRNGGTYCGPCWDRWLEPRPAAT